MRLTCPRCHAKSVIPDERVPSAGAWAKCPKCQEKFFIKPPAASGETAAEAPGPSPPSPRARDEKTQNLLNRLKAKRGAEAEGDAAADGPPLTWETLTVFPEPATSYTPYYFAMLLFAAAVVALMVVGFQQAVNRPRETAAVPQPPVLTQYDERGLRADLLALRDAQQLRKLGNRRVYYSGMESRVFKYFLERLGPDLCQEIISLRIRTERFPLAFTAVAQCLDPGRDSPEIRVVWEGKKAVVTMPGRGGRLEVDLGDQAKPVEMTEEVRIFPSTAPTRSAPESSNRLWD